MVLTELISYFETKPVDLKEKVQIVQKPMDLAVTVRTLNGVVQPRMVYVVVSGRVSESLLIPFGEYDEWSLRDRYNEALRIMNTLGASTILCESFREVKRRSRFGIFAGPKVGQVTLERVQNGGFDYQHVGVGRPPADPSPLTWPDEPGFRAAVEGVLHNGATEVTLNIRSSNTFTLHSELGLRLKKLGFEIGVEHERRGLSSLHIRAEFPSPQKKGWL